MWSLKQFGDIFLISHCDDEGSVLLRGKNGIYTKYIRPIGLAGTSNFIDNVPSQCPQCHQEVPEGLVIQMKLLTD